MHQAKKKFGQNFLKDHNLLKKIVSSAKIEGLDVIEVGPGMGALTQFLVLNARTVTAYEIDTSLKPILAKFENNHPNLKIIYGDFLDMEIPNGTFHLVANIPYYITSPIIFKFIELPQIKSATIMIQKEVADRINAKPNSKQYNALSIILQYYCHVKKVMDVPRHMFTPKPNVDSVVIRLEKYDTRPLNNEQELYFIELIKHAFKQKRKTLINNLYEAYGVDKEVLTTYLKTFGLDEKIRAEAIDVQTFIEIAKKPINK